MSLTQLLKDQTSQVSLFMAERFPNVRDVSSSMQSEIKGANTLRPVGRVAYSTIGTAFDYRLRYYYAVTPYEELKAHRGAILVCGAIKGIDADSGST